MLRVHSNAQENSSQGSTWLRLDQRKKQVTVMEPTESLKSSSANPSPAPKIFLFDAIFEPMASQVSVEFSYLVLTFVHFFFIFDLIRSQHLYTEL